MDIVLGNACLALCVLLYLQDKAHRQELYNVRDINYERGYKDGLYENVVRICEDDSREAN